MFDNFFNQIDKELGPLNPDWFEELTAKAFRDEGRPKSSKVEEEETVKVSATSALASHSTPKIFKQPHFQSPASILNEESPYEVVNGDSSAFPWTDSSPCLFGSESDKDSQRFDRSCEKPRDYFGLLDTPKRSLAHSAKRISESLGAQINPDLSWTSSFNTPSSLAPTVILPETEEHAPSASGLKDKEATFVRKLFPSLSKGSASNATLSDTSLKQEVIAESETIQSDDLGEKPVCSPNTSLDTSGLWKQKVPSAIEDGDVRNTVQNVLDGAEDVLSIFFSNSTATLRRSKTKERIRRRITDSSKDVKSVVLTSESEEILKDDVETKRPCKNKDDTQWTPLSFSESTLNIDCSDVSLINNHNNVASSEINGCTVFNCIAENSQTFPQTVRLKSYPEGTQCQKPLLDKSPAFMLSRKPRKFVYQVPSSDLSKTVIGHKETQPVCLDQTLKENPSVEEVSSDLNKSTVASENAINNHTQPQDFKQLSTEIHDPDLGLDMTQLSKAFAEDFTQEIMPGALLDVAVKSDQNGQVQHKAELEEKNEDGSQNDISNLADISVNSPNKSTVMLTTFEISHDSGCPTTFSDLDSTTTSCADIKEFFPSFKMANNKAISIPNKTIMKAKASLDEAAGDVLINTLNGTTLKHQTIETLCKSVSGSTNANRSPIEQSIFPNHASRLRVSDAPKSDSSKSFKINISSCSSPQSNESDYKTGLKRNITVSNVGFLTETLLKEELGRGSDSSKCIHQKLDFKRIAERQTMFNINSAHNPTAVDSSREDDEENGTLTASQKADVTELCNLLEEANSQHEFTQSKPANHFSDNHTSEKEWDPDILYGIDFDDSFNCDVKGKHPIKTDSSSVNTSDHIIVDASKLPCTMSKETQNGIVPLSVAEDGSLVDGIKSIQSHFSDNTPVHFFGFKTAKGEAISISEKSLNNARHVFEEDDQKAVCIKEVKVDIGLIKPEHVETEPTFNTFDSMSTENKTYLQIKQDVNFSSLNVNAACKERNKQVIENEGTEQNCLGEKTDVFCVDSNSHFGFSTASGAKLKVPEKALLQARKLLNDVDSLEESQTHKLTLHASGNHNGSMSTTSLKKTKAVSRSNTSIKISEPYLVTKISDGVDRLCFNSEKVFQEQKSSSDPKEVFSKIFPTETFSLQSEEGYGFQTASGKGVSVSACALKKAKDIFKDCDENIDLKMEGINDKLDVEIKQVNAFTPNCKRVTFSDVSFMEANTVLNDSDVTDDDLLLSSSVQQPPQKDLQSEFSKHPYELLPRNGNCGFSTASGKKMSISAGALQSSKDLLSDDGFSCADGSPKTKKVVDIQTDTSSIRKHKGFSTADGKKVAVSAAGLQRAKNLFRDCEEERLSFEDLQHQNFKGFSDVSKKPLTKIRMAFAGCSDISFSHEHETGDSSGNNIGFSTAGGKKVAVSATGLQRAKSLFKDCEEESLASGSHHHQVCQGFSTASGKDVTISEKALSEVRAALAGCDDTSFHHEPENTSGNNIGFSTAGGKKVAISATGLQRAKSLFKDCEEESLASGSHHHQVCQGFSTASGKDVTISEKALSEVRAAFAGCDDTSFHHEPENSSRNNIGFSTAGGKKVAVSATGLQRAKCLFKDCEEESLASGSLQHQVCQGFSTASGKDVTISEKALSEVRAALAGCDDTSFHHEPENTSGNNIGFSTAGGKKVAISATGLQRAKSLFKDCEEESLASGSHQHQVCQGFSTASGKDVTISEKALSEVRAAFAGCDDTSFHHEPENSSRKNIGFSTAGGKKVAVSATGLQRAKCLFKDCEEESLASGSLQHQVCQGFSTASGKDVTISEKALSEVRAALAGCDDTSFHHEPENTSGNNIGFSTAGGKKVAISATGLQRAKSLFKDCEEESLASGSHHHQVCQGFSTASGKDVTISEKALSEVRAAFAGCDDTSFHHEPENSSRNNMGFSTAGGKKVAVSATGLQRAKCLFKDCEEESLASGSLQHQVCQGISTASGKDVTVSEKALSEVRAAFASCDDTSFHHEPENTSGNNIGFSTAGGKKVAISANAVQRAKCLFKDCEEENLSYEEVPPQTKSSHKSSEDMVDGNLKFEQLNKKKYGFSTAGGKGVSVSEVALEEASKLFRDCDAQVTVTDSQLLQSDSSECRPQHKNRQTKTTLRPLPSKATQNEHAKLDLHSLDFYSCTDTQQKYFEQEAMACTKALLADDDLNESGSLAMTEDQKYPFVHELQAQGSFGHKRRKRPFDARNIAGQPPLKRQLLSEFDWTLDTKTSGLTPLKSCPNGTLRDRRVFSYNVHLKSNVTGPDWHPVDQKSDDLEQPCSTVSIQNRFNSDPKGGVFVPPFQKGMKTGTSVCQDVSEVSTGFIPPFKKENKETTEHSNQIDQTSISHNDSVARYCDRKNQHEGSDPKPTTSVESIPLKIMDSEEKDTEACWETLNLARDMQDMRLRKKKRQTIRPLSGSLYLAKTSGVPRIGLRDAVGRKCPGQYTQEELYQHGVHHKVSLIKSENAESFRFDCNDFFKCEVLMESGAVQLADGGWLVPDNKGSVGKDEFYRALCDTPGVDPKLISDTWVFNHYRWIVWKRASMERTFPDLMGNRCLTPEQVLLQLKFRYDVEVDHSQRSALRRIMERDDTPAKTLVLCVCGVAQTGQHPEKPVKDDKTPNAKMESCVVWLTDGWYSIKGQLDIPLSAMLNKGRLRIGDKIVTSGAELVGSQEACPPLEAPESLMLKISANSTRRARWDTKLGYYRDPRPISFPLSSLFTAGGVVSCVNIVVLRSYPTQWMEKKPNGVFIFRNNRAEDREARKHSISKHKSMDLLISKIQTQFEKEMEGKKKSQGQRRTFSRHEIEALQDGEELYEAMERDPAVETHLSASQMDAVSKYRRCLEEKRQAELQERVQKAVMEAQEAEGGCPNRDVTPVWKLSITDAKDLQSNCVYTLNIWRPSQDLYGLLREGHRYRAYHLATSEGKKRSGIAHIQFTATKKTLFQDVEVSPEWLHQHFRARECVSFKELQNPQFSSPCGEVDIVGCIVSIDGKQGHCPLLHLVDENFDLVSVRTYSSLEQLAVEELVKLRALVALSNLQARPYSGPVPSLYAGEQAVFSVNPKESHLQEAMTRLKTFVQTCQHFFSIAEEKVSDVVPSGVLSSFQSPRTPCVQSNPKINGRVTPQQKSVIFSPFTPLNRRTPASACNSEGKDPKCLKRRRGLDYLSRIPSPPPLTPLQKTASPCVNRTFNPPRRSVTPKPPQNESPRASCPPPGEEKWVHDEELAMIDTQALLEGLWGKV